MRVAIGLGASIGPRRRVLERTVRAFASGPETQLIGVSRWYRSPPMRGGTAVGWFLNGVALYETTLSPATLLDRCRALETASGRRRARYWGDRPLDLDILVIERFTSTEPALVVPHPGILDRPFVWWPLREVWPDALPGLSERSHLPSGIVAVGAFAPTRGPA